MNYSQIKVWLLQYRVNIRVGISIPLEIDDIDKCDLPNEETIYQRTHWTLMGSVQDAYP